MVAAAFLLFRAFFKMLRNEEEEKKAEEKPKTLRQSLIGGLALIITAFIGLVLLSVMDWVMGIVSNLGV